MSIRRPHYVAVAFALSGLLASARAWAETRAVVVRKDGTVVQGQLVESVLEDHLTLRLPSGELRQIEWNQIASTTELPGVGETPPAAPPPPPASSSLEALHVSPAPPDASPPPTTADWPEPDRTPPDIMAARLALGLETGYGTPLGPLALNLGYYPVRWIGLEVAGGGVGSTPSGLAENLVFGWPMFGPFEMGLGVGLAQSFVPGAGGGKSGTVTYFDADCSHFTFFMTRELSLRASVGLTFAVNGGSYCDSHPDLCAQTTAANVTAALSWNFDLSHGQN